jgi:hypothetical protein
LSRFVASLASWVLLARDLQASSLIRIFRRVPAASIILPLWHLESRVSSRPRPTKSRNALSHKWLVKHAVTLGLPRVVCYCGQSDGILLSKRCRYRCGLCSYLSPTVPSGFSTFEPRFHPFAGPQTSAVPETGGIVFPSRLSSAIVCRLRPDALPFCDRHTMGRC